MDWLDRFSVLAIVGIAAAVVVVSSTHEPENDALVAPRRASEAHASALDDADTALAERIRKLLANGNVPQAEALTRELLARHPHDGVPHMLLGDVLLRKQQLMAALAEYRQAIDLEPDYLDKKTPLFQGKKLKHVVNEALKALEASPSGEREALDRGLIYYLLRRIAGSCG